MGGLDDSISCLCPEGFLAMNSPLLTYLEKINASVATNLMKSRLSRNLEIGPYKSSANQTAGSILLTHKGDTIHNLI